MDAHLIRAERAWAWFEQGWKLFSHYPGQFFALAFACLLVAIATSYTIPTLVVLVFVLPLLYAGLLFGFHEARSGQPPSVGNLLHVVGQPGKRTPFLVLGLLTLGLYAFLGSASVAMVEGPRFAMDSTPGLWDQIGWVIRLLAGFGSFIFFVLIQLATVYAAPLVLFAEVGPLDALRSSFNACSKNWRAILICLVILLILAFVATILALFSGYVIFSVLKGAGVIALGTQFLELMRDPVVFLGAEVALFILTAPLVLVALGAVYSSYRELFE